MKTAKLNKQGKGWALVGDKTIVISGDFGLTDDMNGKEVEFDNTGGAVKLIRFEGKDYQKKAFQADSGGTENWGKDRQNYRSNPQGGRNDRSTDVENRKPARAPYNFVPLNEQVVSGNGQIDHSKNNQLSGIIEITLEAQTPLYIMGYDGEFFRVNDKPYIPGSSIRGLLKNLVVITAYGQLDQFEDRQLYRRSSLSNDGGNVSSGFLLLNNGKFVIHKAECFQENRSNISQPHQYEFRAEDNSCMFSTGKFGSRLTIWKFRKPFKPNQIDIDPKVISGYSSDDTRSEDAIDLLLSLKKGKIVNKTGSSIKKNGSDVNIPVELGIPVFFRVQSSTNTVISIGHAKYHRIPYSHSIGDHIPQTPRGNSPDFASIIFGNTELAGKVYFEDLKPIGAINKELPESKYPKILSSPKPTTYQHYLDQPNGVKTNQMAQKNWSDDDAEIRGYKQYWHRNTSSNIKDPDTWIETKPPTKSHPNPINPIAIGSKFQGRVRFDNLTPQELGALLFVLDLPSGCCHKLGFGKSLGLGSAIINTTLKLINRKARYEKIFDKDGNWINGEKEATLKLFIDAFALFIGEATNQNNITDASQYWSMDSRLQELKHMLTFEHDTQGVSWQNRTRYMLIDHPTNDPKNEYKLRPVLPKPSEVVKDDTYRES